MYSKRNIALMYAISFFQGMVFYASIATLYRQAAGLNLAQIALIESVSYLICLATELPWGLIADRIGYRSTMILSCGLYFVSKLIFWQADSFGGFLLERFFLSISVSGLSGVDTSVLYLSAPEGDSQKVFGRWNALGTAGLLFSAWFYSVFIGKNYRLAGLATAVSYGIAALLSLGLQEVRSPDREERQTLQGFFSLLRETAKDRRFLLFLLGYGLYCEAVQMITVWLNQGQYLRCGLEERGIGMAYLAVTVLSLCGAFSSNLTRRLGQKPFAALVFLLTGGLGALLTVTRSPWASFGAIAAIAALHALIGPLATTLMNQRVVTADRATMLSIFAVLTDLVSAGANLLYGRAADLSLSAAFLIGAGSCVIACISFFFCYGKTE